MLIVFFKQDVMLEIQIINNHVFGGKILLTN